MKLAAVIGTMIASLPFAPEAHAFVDPPRFEPALPREAQPVTLILRTGSCHGIFESETRPTVTSHDREIELIVEGTHASGVDCIFGLEGHDHFFRLGSYAAGDYTVTVRMQHAEDPDLDYEVLATVPLHIATDAPSSIPTLGAGMLGVMAAALVCLAVQRR